MPDYYYGNRYLSLAEMQTNATFIYNYLTTNYGWTLNAVAGLLGNTQTESTHNPAIWQGLTENTGGYGLCQWDSANKIISYLESRNLELYDLAGQLDRLEYERLNGLQYYITSTYPITFSEFITSNLDVSYLAQAWAYNYERPRTLPQPKRGTQAQYWYEYLSGQPTPEPQPTTEMTITPETTDLLAEDNAIFYATWLPENTVIDYGHIAFKTSEGLAIANQSYRGNSTSGYIGQCMAVGRKESLGQHTITAYMTNDMSISVSANVNVIANGFAKSRKKWIYYLKRII